MKSSVLLGAALVALFPQIGRAAPDARLTRTVLAQNLAISGWQDELPPGKTWIHPEDIFLSPDGSRLAYLPAPLNPDDLRHVVLDGKVGPTLSEIGDRAWSSGSRGFLYVGQAQGAVLQTLYSNNAPTPFVGEKMDAVCAADVPEKPGVKGLASYKKDGKIYIGTTAVPDSIPAVPTGLFLSPDGVDFLLSAYKNDQLCLWHASTFLGQSAQFSDFKGPLAPLWSPVKRHVAFAIQIEGKATLCIDTTPLCVLSSRPRLLWNATGTQLLMFGPDVNTISFDFGADGVPKVAKNTGESARGDAVWSQNGAHFAFFSAQTGKIIVDGEAKTDANRFSDGENDGENDPLLRARFNSPGVAVSNDGHLAHTSVQQLLGGTSLMTELDVDSVQTALFDKIFDVRWSETLKQPIFMLLQGSTKDRTKTDFAVHLGKNDDIDLLSKAPISNLYRPLFPLTIVAPDLARVVMLEGDQIVRYDISLRAK